MLGDESRKPNLERTLLGVSQGIQSETTGCLGKRQSAREMAAGDTILAGTRLCVQRGANVRA